MLTGRNTRSSGLVLETLLLLHAYTICQLDALMLPLFKDIEPPTIHRFVVRHVSGTVHRIRVCAADRDST